MTTATEETIKELLEKTCLKDVAEFTPQSTLREDLGMDSLDMVEFVMGLEETFKVAITDEEGDKLRTFADVTALMEKKGA